MTSQDLEANLASDQIIPPLVPKPDRKIRPVIVAIAVLFLFGIAYSAGASSRDGNVEASYDEGYKVGRKEGYEEGRHFAPPPKVETVYQTPQACKDAIVSAREVAKHVAEAFGNASEYPPMVAEAAQAGYLADVRAIQRITARMENLNKRLEDRTALMSGSVDSFNRNAAGCQ